MLPAATRIGSPYLASQITQSIPHLIVRTDYVETTSTPLSQLPQAMLYCSVSTVHYVCNDDCDIYTKSFDSWGWFRFFLYVYSTISTPHRPTFHIRCVLYEPICVDCFQVSFVPSVLCTILMGLKAVPVLQNSTTVGFASTLFSNHVCEKENNIQSLVQHTYNDSIYKKCTV